MKTINEESVVKLYKEGWSKISLIGIFNISAQKIKEILVKHNIKLRGPKKFILR